LPANRLRCDLGDRVLQKVGMVMAIDAFQHFDEFG